MDSIGQVLREARERKQITTSRAAAETNIKIQHIEAMERDDFSRMAAPIYAKGFIRIYAEYLGLDPAQLIAEYMARYAPRERPPLIVPEFEARKAGVPGERAVEAESRGRVDWRAWLDRAREWGRRGAPWVGLAAAGAVLVWGGGKVVNKVVARAAARQAAEAATRAAELERKRADLPLLAEPPEPYMDAWPDLSKERAP